MTARITEDVGPMLDNLSHIFRGKAAAARRQAEANAARRESVPAEHRDKHPGPEGPTADAECWDRHAEAATRGVLRFEASPSPAANPFTTVPGYQAAFARGQALGRVEFG